MTSKRKQILDKAINQLRKSREAMDPSVLKKIRRMVASSPDIMKKLGLTDELKPQEADLDMPLTAKTPVTDKVTAEQAIPQKPDVVEANKSPAKFTEELLALKDKILAKSPPNVPLEKAKTPETPVPVKSEPFASAPSKGYEKIDQAKTMEVMAKLMALNPSAKESIKSVIKKAGK